MHDLTRWRNWLPVSFRHSPFVSLHRDIDGVVKDFFQHFEPRAMSKELENLTIQPAVDLVEDDHQYKIELEMPGVGEEEIKVSIKDGVLVIQAKKEVSHKNKGKNYLKREINYGSYEMHLSLPEYVDTEQAKASFKKGMLWISMPKKPGVGKSLRELPIEKA